MKCICGGKIRTENTLSINEQGFLSSDYPVEIVRYRKCDLCGHTFKTIEDVSVIRDFFKLRLLLGAKSPFF